MFDSTTITNFISLLRTLIIVGFKLSKMLNLWKLCFYISLICSAVISAELLDDESQLLENVKDVAYYLRNHKFNEVDKRLKHNTTYFYGNFPSPELYELHPEVQRFCEFSDFNICLKYLFTKSQLAKIRRQDDTVTLIHKQKLSMSSSKDIITKLDSNCKKLLNEDENYWDDNQFSGPLERFQWRTTASYYMCWYTINNRPILKHFNEKCDNYANCLDPKHGISNSDPRADDSVPFACAFYSFCPDVCCPEKHVKSIEECSKSKLNPCKMAVMSNNDKNPRCLFPNQENNDFYGIQLNHWNLTCPCPNENGFKWSSRFQSCIDIDECLYENQYNITEPCGGPEVSVCYNLPGSVTCVCQLGYIKDIHTNLCVSDPSFKLLLNSFYKLNSTELN